MRLGSGCKLSFSSMDVHENLKGAGFKPESDTRGTTLEKKARIL